MPAAPPNPNGLVTTIPDSLPIKMSNLDPLSIIINQFPINVSGINFVGNGGNINSVISNIDSVPDYVDSLVGSQGISVHITLNDIGQDPDFSLNNNPNAIPRGWAGQTASVPWSSSPVPVTLGMLPGVFDPGSNEVILATSPVVPEGSYNVDDHEFGHGADRALGAIAGSPGGLLSNSPGFLAAVAADTQALAGWSSVGYFTPQGNPSGYVSEAFAESFAKYYGNVNSSSADEAGDPNFGDGGPQNAPHLFAFMQSLDQAAQAASSSSNPNQAFKQSVQPLIFPQNRSSTTAGNMTYFE